MELRILLAALMLISAWVPASASSLVDTELATLETVRVFISTGSLGFEAIPELDPDKLKLRIERKASKILERNGLAIDENSTATLFIIVDKSHDNLDREFLAVSVRAELVEPVTPIRQIIWESKTPFQAITWSWDDVDLVRRADATAETMEMVKFVIESFAQSAETARIICEREGLGSVN